MSGGTYALVVMSALAHAWWNFLLKRSGGTQAFVGLSKIAEAVILAPLLLSGLLIEPSRLTALWIWPTVGAALVLANYVLLTAAYRHGDLSLVYPVSRGAVLLFLPAIAYLTIGEHLDLAGGAAIVLIVVGIGATALRGSGRYDGRALVFAMLTAAAAACYTIWDKQAVQVLTPLAYFAAYTVIVGLAYGLILKRASTRQALREEWRIHWRPILAVAVLNMGSYMLALIALRTGKASYVIALRQLSIAAGALLGWALLGESIPPMRRAGIALVVGGCVLLALAR